MNNTEIKTVCPETKLEDIVFFDTSTRRTYIFDKELKGLSMSDKGLFIDVYRSSGPDCTAGGISSKVDRIFIVTPGGNWTIEDAIETVAGELCIFVTEYKSSKYVAARPVFVPEGHTPGMYGGNLATSSDSRVNHVYHIHDRFETWETYNGMSR